MYAAFKALAAAAALAAIVGLVFQLPWSSPGAGSSTYAYDIDKEDAQFGDFSGWYDEKNADAADVNGYSTASGPDAAADGAVREVSENRESGEGSPSRDGDT